VQESEFKAIVQELLCDSPLPASTSIHVVLHVMNSIHALVQSFSSSMSLWFVQLIFILVIVISLSKSAIYKDQNVCCNVSDVDTYSLGFALR